MSVVWLFGNDLLEDFLKPHNSIEMEIAILKFLCIMDKLSIY